jgi:hypothetical protein
MVESGLAVTPLLSGGGIEQFTGKYKYLGTLTRTDLSHQDSMDLI